MSEPLHALAIVNFCRFSKKLAMPSSHSRINGAGMHRCHMATVESKCVQCGSVSWLSVTLMSKNVVATSPFGLGSGSCPIQRLTRPKGNVQGGSRFAPISHRIPCWATP